MFAKMCAEEMIMYLPSGMMMALRGINADPRSVSRITRQFISVQMIAIDHCCDVSTSSDAPMKANGAMSAVTFNSTGIPGSTNNPSLIARIYERGIVRARDGRSCHFILRVVKIG